MSYFRADVFRFFFVDRGARRFVVNNATKFLYYTADHYETFVRIR